VLKTISIVAAGSLGVVCSPTPAQGEVTFDLVTITDPGNAPYQTTPDWRYVNGRGAVDYEYRIGRLEITTAQWLPFVQLFWDDLGTINPSYWGADLLPDRTWALRTDVPDPGMLPCEGISWEEAAMYVNWLHNGQRSDLASTQSGVYDTSTFTLNPDFTFNHQLEPAPGAKYWIPSLDEWLKAAHYDPDKDGPGQGGWWQFVNSSDAAPVPGLPGQGDTTAFVDLTPRELWDVPLGAYPHVQSPWGLLDLSGGTLEWATDDYYGWGTNIVANGTWAGFNIPPENLDDIIYYATQEPRTFRGGLRIASAVIPAPAGLVVLLGAGAFLSRGRKRSYAKREHSIQ